LIDGTRVDYTSYSVLTQARVATNHNNGAQVENQYIDPCYIPHKTEIHAVTSQEGIVDPNNVPITLIDLNVAGRCWTAVTA